MPPSVLMWGADYSQLELRIMARLSYCRSMIEIFMDPEGDIHADTTWKVFGVHPKDQTPALRLRGKTLNFGIGYGAQGETVQEVIMKVALRQPELHIPIPSLSECKQMVKTFWLTHPEVYEWVEYVKEDTRDKGYAETLYARRRYLPLIRHPSSDLRARAERQAVNHKVQGTAGDLVKNAMLMLWRECDKYDASVLCQVHDELWGLVDRRQSEDWLSVVRPYMVLDQPLSPVPLKVEPKLISRWSELK